MLIGRQKELERLETLYEENSFRMLWSQVRALLSPYDSPVP